MSKIIEVEVKSQRTVDNIILVGEDIPIECVDISTHSSMSKEYASIIGMINWELIRSGRIEVDDFDKFDPKGERGYFGKLCVSINDRSGLHSPGEYKEILNVVIKNKRYTTKDTRELLSKVFLKLALNSKLKLVKTL